MLQIISLVFFGCGDGLAVSVDRQQDSKGCPLPQLAFDSNFALMVLDNTMTDRQTQTCTFDCGLG